jgi:hypothetical protein
MHEDPAESGSVGPVEGVSEDSSKVNRGQDVITEPEKVKTGAETK